LHTPNGALFLSNEKDMQYDDETLKRALLQSIAKGVHYNDETLKPWITLSSMILLRTA
jgi:hypothetical protein